MVDIIQFSVLSEGQQRQGRFYWQLTTGH